MNAIKDCFNIDIDVHVYDVSPSVIKDSFDFFSLRKGRDNALLRSFLGALYFVQPNGRLSSRNTVLTGKNCMF